MKIEIVDLLLCPAEACGSPLVPEAGADIAGGELREGLLECGGCGAQYPVIAGVAVLMEQPAAWLRQNYYYVASGAAAVGGIGKVPGNWLESHDWRMGNRHPENYYETERWLNIFASTHYDESPGGADDATPIGRFLAGQPQVFDVLLEGLRRYAGEGIGYALDVGTNVGGMAHRCARIAKRVIGIDTSFNAILAARRIHAGQPVPLRHYRRCIDGRRYEERPLPPAPANTEFLVTSAFAPALRGGFDLVTALNVVDSVPDPRRLLRALRAALRPGGVLALSSPYSWGSDDVPVDRWIGGSAELPSADAMRRELASQGFELLEEQDGVSWVLREHARWYRAFVNHCLIARRVD